MISLFSYADVKKRLIDLQYFEIFLYLKIFNETLPFINKIYDFEIKPAKIFLILLTMTMELSTI